MNSTEMAHTLILSRSANTWEQDKGKKKTFKGEKTRFLYMGVSNLWNLLLCDFTS